MLHRGACGLGMDHICVEVGEINDRKFGGAVDDFIRDHLRPVYRRREQWSMIVAILAPIDGGRRIAGAE